MLRLKRIGLDAGPAAQAYLSRGCRALDLDAFPAGTRVEIHHDRRSIVAALVIADASGPVGDDEVGLGARAFAALGLPEGAAVMVDHARPPASLAAMRSKIRGQALADDDFAAIVRDIVAGRYEEREIAAFLTAAAHALSDAEVLGLARARAAVAPALRWTGKVADKHSIGGIPGNRVTPIVVGIAVAAGLTIPKTSSRAITSPAGTADAMEVVARVDLTTEEVRAVVREAGGCIAWNGRLTQSPLDDVMNAVERPLGLDSRQLLVASILSKKRAAGATHVYVDIPLGPSAKVRDPAHAEHMRTLFEGAGRAMGLAIEAHVSDGSAPIGRGIGPVLEMRDALAVLHGEAAAPADLRGKALGIAGRLIELAGGAPAGGGVARAADLLRRGDARRAFERIAAAQGPPAAAHDLGARRHDVPAPRSGTVATIDCYRIATLARLAGAPADKGAGIDLLKQRGEAVEQGEPLYRLHASLDWDFEQAVAAAGADSGVTVAPAR